MGKGKHRMGGKITSKHTSAIEAVAQLVDFLKDNEEVTKISLGVISVPKTARKDANKALKVIEEPAGLLVKVTQKNVIQEFRVYTPSKLALYNLIKNYALQQGWIFKN